MGRVVGIHLNACILCEIVQLFSQLIFLNENDYLFSRRFGLEFSG